MPDSNPKNPPDFHAIRLHENARLHLFVLEGEGAQVIEELLAAHGGEFLSRSTVLYVARGFSSAEPAHRLRKLNPAILRVFPAAAAAVAALDEILASAAMGTWLYVAGSEAFISQVACTAMARGIDPDTIGTQKCGPDARRVQCVHCKTIMDEVTQNHTECAQCGTMLQVADHFSSRLGAYLGVAANAEVQERH